MWPNLTQARLNRVSLEAASRHGAQSIDASLTLARTTLARPSGASLEAANRRRHNGVVQT